MYHRFASYGLAALSVAASVSAGPLLHRDEVCPPGHTMSVYYVTVTVEPTATSTPSVEPTTTIQATSTFTETVTVIPAEPTQPQITTSAAGIPATTDIQSTLAPVVSEAASIETSVYLSVETSSISPSSSSAEKLVAVETVAAAHPTTTAAAAPQPTTTTVSTSQVHQPTTSSTTSTTSSSAASASSSSSSSSNASSGESYSGEATYFTGDVAVGACSFSGYTLPSSVFGTALSGAQWSDAAECGACVQVTGPSGNSIKAMIVDECPECAANHLDLFQNAFGELAATSEGVIDIEWSYVTCGIESPLSLKNKEGTSEYWFSMQVVNANERVVSLEVSTDGGNTWQETTRTAYNYFENDSGFGTDSVDVRVTSKSGKVVRVENVGCASGEQVTASANF
ncbi:hypothetical protein FE257_009020 [Aspergillus nanangensis]|uniref:Expansin-like EG45 domain-containing protein n=1 Tax=Aspergillus nanangensis TaxID=2582783 RepID=A0AAD4CYI0_ASPNN|nr:hypothetical protein FE257_009020 [Aspergillus nanangensis]